MSQQVFLCRCFYHFLNVQFHSSSRRNIFLSSYENLKSSIGWPHVVNSGSWCCPERCSDTRRVVQMVRLRSDGRSRSSCKSVEIRQIAKYEILMPHTRQLEHVAMETAKWHTQGRSFRLFFLPFPSSLPLSQSYFLLCWRSYFYRLLYKMRLLFSTQCVIFCLFFPVRWTTMGSRRRCVVPSRLKTTLGECRPFRIRQINVSRKMIIELVPSGYQGAVAPLYEQMTHRCVRQVK